MTNPNSRLVDGPPTAVTMPAAGRIGQQIVWLLTTGIYGVAAHSVAAADSGPNRSFEQTVQPFLATYCLDCHNAETSEGEFRLDSLPVAFDSQSGPLWAEALGRISAGEMPPPDSSQPSTAELSAVTDWIGTALRRGREERMRERSAVSHDRLSREEYGHSVYDLLGVRYDVNAPGAFTPDPIWHGFERIGSELSLAPTHIEKAITAAETIVDAAFPERQPAEKTRVRDAIDLHWNITKRRPEIEAAGLADRVRVALWPGERLSGANPGTLDGGRYRVRVTLSGVYPKGGQRPHLTLYSKGSSRMLFEADVDAPEGEPATLEFETWLPDGNPKVMIANESPGPHNKGRSGRSSTFLFTTLDDPASRAPWQRKLSDDEGRPLFPLLIVDRVEWTGPIVTDEDRRKREAVIPLQTASRDQIGDALAGFASRAWRRPVEASEVERLAGLVATARDEGQSIRQAMRPALIAVLLSHEFQYLSFGDAQQPTATLDDLELASRLSYFLWSSAPDAELMQAAADSRLTDSGVRRRQVRRMLSDKKSERFVRSFPVQWLQLQRLGEFPPDETLYPDYDAWLEESMKEETLAVFARMFAENRPIREFVRADWTVLNDRLARHYGLPSPETSGFDVVSLDPAANRGGLLTQAALLSMTSDGTRHRPVHRGVWLSESLLGVVPNPPPANVDAVQPSPPNGPKVSLRVRLDAHKTNTACAACHAKIDPLGFALENYDAIGRYRTVEPSEGTGDDPPVDASGVLPDGRAFDDLVGFQQLLLDDERQLARTLVVKLATYALRRPLTFDDRDAVERIVDVAASSGYRLADLVEAVAMSDLLAAR